MVYHRPEWVWYTAQLVVESRVEGLAEPILQVESILFRAASPEEAYAKAQSLCNSPDHVYRNKLGEVVSQHYLGIHDIDDLQAEQPEDELVLQVRTVSGTPECGVQNLVRSKSELALFGGRQEEDSRLSQ